MDKGSVFSFYFSLTIKQNLLCIQVLATRSSGSPPVDTQWRNTVLDPLHLPPI